MVIKPSPVIVYPDTRNEIEEIEVLKAGSEVRAYSGSNKVEGPYTAIEFDGDSAYIASDAIKLVEAAVEDKNSPRSP
jgi:hypothetical protein